MTIAATQSVTRPDQIASASPDSSRKLQKYSFENYDFAIVP
jgi:hypothetical protein